MQPRSFLHPVFMKKNLFTVLLLCMAFLLRAQPATDKIYGFRQRVIPGNKSVGDIDETGKLLKKKTPDVFQYAIYLTSASKAKIYPVQMWINGEALSVEAETKTAMQLMQETANMHNDKTNKIIRITDGTIWKLTPVPLITDKSVRRAKTLANENAVVVLYKSGGKLRYGVLKKFTDLDPVSLQ